MQAPHSSVARVWARDDSSAKSDGMVSRRDMDIGNGDITDVSL